MRLILVSSILALSVVLSGCGRHRGEDGDAKDGHHAQHEKKKKKKHRKDKDEPAETTTAADTANPVIAIGAGPATAAQPDTRKFKFNGRDATEGDLATLKKVEAMYGKPAPEGEYWYDPMSGAAGQWGGPTLGFLPAKLDLGGPLPANASGGGEGKVTGVFINGREIHPVDYKVLFNIYGQVLPGRWWVDGNGNAGKEGGPALMNLVSIAQQRAAAGKGSGASSYYRSDGRGNNAFVGGGCVSVSSTSGSGSDKKTYDYYGSGC
jgi:hypothetical protein